MVASLTKKMSTIPCEGQHCEVKHSVRDGIIYTRIPNLIACLCDIPVHSECLRWKRIHERLIDKCDVCNYTYRLDTTRDMSRIHTEARRAVRGNLFASFSLYLFNFLIFLSLSTFVFESIGSCFGSAVFFSLLVYGSIGLYFDAPDYIQHNKRPLCRLLLFTFCVIPVGVPCMVDMVIYNVRNNYKREVRTREVDARPVLTCGA